MKAFAAIAAGACLVLLAGCHTVPVTGRSALDIVSDRDVAEMSKAAFEEMKLRHKQSRDRAMIDRVNRVGERLASVVPYWQMPGAEWEFVVFDEPREINAFAMAGGKVGVFSGLFTIARNDDQLASVLAHEIAHVTARHVNERLSQQMMVNAGGIVMGAALPVTYTSNLVLGAYGLSTGAGVLAFDRAKEIEADHIGLVYMARAGFNPEEAIKALENLEAASAGQGAQTPGWFSTHPSTPARLLRLRENLPKAVQIYKNQDKKTEVIVIK